MKMDLSFIRRKVARRIFVQFVFCALVPIIALAIVSFFQVRAELEKQGQTRLHEATRSLGTSVYERLLNLENDLKILSIQIHTGPGDPTRIIEQRYVEHMQRPLEALALATNTGETVSLFGKTPPSPKRTAKQEKHFLSGKPLLFISLDSDDGSHICMMTLVDPQNPEKGILIGKLNSMYLWGLDENNALPAMTELTVLDSMDNVLYSTISVPSEFGHRPEFGSGRSGISHFEWKHRGEPYQAAYSSVFMNYSWGYPQLTVVMSTPKHHIFAPIAFFERVFPLVFLLSLWVVLFLSAVQIRRTTEPLKELTEGTRRISNKDFDTRVSVISGDEFEELGASFNDMARQLKRQFEALATIGAIERAVLSSLDTREIIDTVTSRMREVFDNDAVTVTLLDSEEKHSATSYLKRVNSETEDFPANVALSTEDIQRLYDNREFLSIDKKEGFPSYLKSLVKDSVQACVVFPLFVKGALAGFIALGLRNIERRDPDDLMQVRQIANQVAVALANAQLLEDLNLLNWGALTALARTVDAKSPWTAGHSERVAKTAIEIGRVLGLSTDEIDDLHRAALLHDIGKIATPANILDKPGTLTDEERRVVEAHPSTGARILEPIQAYKSIIPAVLQHHERYDGKGYPNGLAGEEISLAGRIMAVADVYDSLVSDRPYRPGMDKERVLKVIKKETGTYYDPNVVKALLIFVNQYSEMESDYGKEKKVATVAAF
ncbi:MAG: HD domain-containing protein [Deltaproteobacteria bacterium]|nr:HD domain-containing protein [Deltaproteobacteria bacterium]